MFAQRLLPSAALLTILLGHAAQAQAPIKTSQPGAAPKPAVGTPLMLRPPAAPKPAARSGPTSLLKVNCTYQDPNFQIPWQKENPGQRRGLGSVLSQRRILVTAQLVANATYIELELSDGTLKIPAKVLARDYEANLALLAADSSPEKTEPFFSQLKPIELDEGATIGDMLALWQSGRVGELIVTPLRISKVLVSGYVVSTPPLLVYEAQGIVRSENNSFTLPAVRGDKLAGLLLRYDSKNQVAALLPAPIIAHFLRDVADGNYEGFPTLGVELQNTQDDQWRDYLGLAGRKGGIYVSRVLKGGSAQSLGIKSGDILLSINGHEVDSRGDYRDERYGALNASHLLRGSALIGDEAQVEVLREGKVLRLKGKLTRRQAEDYLVPPYLFEKGPPYLVLGGVVFGQLTESHLMGFNQRSGAVQRLARIAARPEELEREGRRRVVFLSTILPTPSTQGYDQLSGQVVLGVNGRKITRLRDVAEALKSPVDGIHTLKLREFPHLLHLDAKLVEADNLTLQNGPYRISQLQRLD